MKKRKIKVGNFTIYRDKNNYQVWEKITDPEHPFYEHSDKELSHLVFNYQTVTEIQKSITELRNCNELLLL